MWDVIVVGGGITSLQLAALLANEGKKVLLLEKTAHIGGRAMIQEKDGFILDYGIHLVRFGEKSALARVCKKLGAKLDFIPIGTSYLLDEDGEVKVFPTKPTDFLFSKMFSWSDALYAIKLIPAFRRGASIPDYRMSVSEWMKKKGLKGGIAKYIILLSSSMQVCPFIERASMGELLDNISRVLTRRHSVEYPRGGWKRIFNILKEAILKNGEIRVNNEVKNIIVENGIAKGVLVDGEVIQAKIIVCGLPVQQLFKILDERLCPQDFVHKCQNLKPTAGVSIDYALDRKITDSSGLWYIWKPRAFGIFTSNLCASVAPEGKQLFTILSITEIEYLKDKKAVKELINHIEEKLFQLFPQMKEAILWRRPLYLSLIDGAEVNVEQTKFDRPSCVIPGIKKLFLVGDSLNAAGAGGDIGHESVWECYEEIQKHKGEL